MSLNEKYKLSYVTNEKIFVSAITIRTEIFIHRLARKSKNIYLVFVEILFHQNRSEIILFRNTHQLFFSNILGYTK
jgi:hypothetical protein